MAWYLPNGAGNFNASGNPTGRLWADGVATFTKVWDNRTSYGYTA